MKKRLIALISAMFIGNGLLIGGGTYALLTSSTTNTSNQFATFQAETINVQSSPTESTNTTFRSLALMANCSGRTSLLTMFYDTNSNPTGTHPYDKTISPPSGEIPGRWAPGDTVTRYWSVNNLGSQAKFTQISAKLDSLTGPKGTISPGTQTYKDFLNHMKVAVYSPEDSYAKPVFNGTFQEILGGSQPLDTIMYLGKGCTGYKPKFVVSMDLDAGNNLQAVKGVLDFTLSPEQTRHNCFDPPFSNWDYSMKCGSMTPIKFECFDADGSFIRNSRDVKLVISGGGFTNTYILGNGLSCNGGHYQANIYGDKNRFIDGLTYTATVYNGSEICGQKTFTTEPGNRSNSR
ncbi:hypothetical protein ACPUYX_00725 [Desulfosporosinus sp. SYSU MS00001]|uniref:hypothetical protein n=1 Tax=Desulfosporosinus sp. SYSU MS00001 TaxID=3416284 RepID=UPI003CFB84F7